MEDLALFAANFVRRKRGKCNHFENEVSTFRVLEDLAERKD